MFEEDNEQTQESQKEVERIEGELFYSISNDDPVSLQKLLASGVDPDTTFSGFDPLGKSLFWYPLHFCCEKGRYQCARVLLDAGASKDSGDKWCMTPLMYAIQTEWYNMAELMLSVGAGVDNQDTKGRTSLHLALDCSDHTGIKLLCNANADVNIRDLVGRTPLWHTVSKDGRSEHLTELLACNPEPNAYDLREKRTPLQVAIHYAQNDRLDYVSRLLAAGSEVNHRDEANFNSMLNLLAKSKRNGKGFTDEEMTIALMLLDAGYVLDDRPARVVWHKFGGTAIKMAADQGATQLVELFLEHGADPDIPDDVGTTPLLAAAMNNHLATCVALIRSNCQLDVVGEIKIEHVMCEVSPLKIATVKGHFDVARLLLDAGARSRSEKYLFDGLGLRVEVHQTISLTDCEQWFWLLERISTPVPLFDACIFLLRSTLGRSLDAKLRQLPLPPFIRSCVRLEHVLCGYE